MSFQFSLQQAMDICKQHKDEARRQYEIAEEEFKTVATALYHLLKEKEQVEQQLEFAQDEKQTVAQLISTKVYLQGLGKQIVSQQQQTNESREHMEHQKRKLHECVRSFKQYERLKEKQMRNAQEEERRTEQKQMDELSTTHYMRLRVK
ncbi:flagellar export protein FliJ [Bacillus sp. JCM 19041]|uniref:flagellar export protein FliJ n=1 Tax=Bacillus sp. JCM 19041 TaxID=1460637 RepID=UPI0006D042CB